MIIKNKAGVAFYTRKWKSEMSGISHYLFNFNFSPSSSPTILKRKEVFKLLNLKHENT